MFLLNPSSMLFMFTLILGTVITISSPTWFVSWLGLELNTLSFIPLIMHHKNSISSQAALKYFLIQALSSATLMASAAMMLLSTASPQIMISLSLLLKMGAAPLHFWLPPIMQSLPWIQCLILMTIQKIAPMALMSYILSPVTSKVLMMASIVSALVGGIGGLNQTLLRKIMAFSSINHMAWMLAALYMEKSLWLNYFLIYSIVSSSVVILMNMNQIFHLKQLFFIPNNQMYKVSTLLSLFSLGGLPPLLGFIPKMMMTTFMAKNMLILWLLTLMMTALLTLFYYTRISIMSFMLTMPKYTMNFKENLNQKSTSFLIINMIPIFSPLIVLIQF
uniref:NADH-ubiquinone oxidoreductase chain 2 n=1 Tax=Hymenocera picta TaxID=343320 RepID=A0A346RC84_9EUCA|nr:NADH dehydrogenase subunit 2 [Hymenocera picta]AXS63681.1 NADH dehydrogenase subunit 2 [Hymenocera picta]